jgi:hypothetical protein
MFLYCRALNENLFKVDNDETIKTGVEKRRERCFGNSILIQSDLMITASKVDFGEEFCASKAIEYFIYTR